MDKLKMLFLSVFTRDRQHYIVLYVNRPSYAWRFEALLTVKEVVTRAQKGNIFLSKQALLLLREEEILKASKNQRKPKPHMRFRSKPKTACKTINVIQRLELGKFAKNSFKQPILSLWKHPPRKHNFTLNFWKLRWDFVGKFDSNICFVYQVGVASYW